MKKYETLIFDLDDTLIDNKKLKNPALGLENPTSSEDTKLFT